jgi:hypothetical protein
LLAAAHYAIAILKHNPNYIHQYYPVAGGGIQFYLFRKFIRQMRPKVKILFVSRSRKNIWNFFIIPQLLSMLLVVLSAKTVANETDEFFRQDRRRPAAVWGIRQGGATTHGGKRRRFMSLFWRKGLLDLTPIF